jgi:ketosteroid isomerase-like protein
MTDDAVVIAASGEALMGKQAILADVSSTNCKVKSFDLADTKLRQLSADVAILTYNLTQDVMCEAKLPAKVFATAVYVRQGGKWRWASYQETALK